MVDDLLGGSLANSGMSSQLPSSSGKRTFAGNPRCNDPHVAITVALQQSSNRLSNMATSGRCDLSSPVFHQSKRALFYGLATTSLEPIDMDATAVYPNSAPVLAAHGLGGTLAGNDPDHVPLEPDLINDARRRLAPGGCAVDASGVMRLHVRNALGYAFLRPHHRDKLYPRDTKRVTQLRDALNESVFYRRDYRDFVPHDLMMDFILNESPYVELRGAIANAIGVGMLAAYSLGCLLWLCADHRKILAKW